MIDEGPISAIQEGRYSNLTLPYLTAFSTIVLIYPNSLQNLFHQKPTCLEQVEGSTLYEFGRVRRMKIRESKRITTI